MPTLAGTLDKVWWRWQRCRQKLREPRLRPIAYFLDEYDMGGQRGSFIWGEEERDINRKHRPPPHPPVRLLTHPPPQPRPSLNYGHLK